MKKGDFVIIGAVVMAVVLSIALLFSFSKKGTNVVIKQDDKVIYDNSINVNETIQTGTNTIIIRDGEVYVSEANCKNQICVNSGKISKKGESIVCLPNKVIVEIK